MSERFRLARPEEVPAVARLVTHSFPAPGRTAEWWEEHLRADRGGVEILWVGEAEGELAAACRLYRFRQWIGGAPLPVMGLGLVTISPTHRRRGLAGRLVEAGLRHARERGDVASALYPFRVTFYEKLGYGLAGEALEYRLPPESLPDAPERRGVRLVRTGEEWTALRGVYDRWIRGQTGQMERAPEDWARLREGPENAAVVYRTEGGEAEGYAVVRYRPDLPAATRWLEVVEHAWLTPAARSGIHAWLASLGDQHRLLAYRAHPEEHFSERVSEPRLPQGSIPGWELWFPAATQMLGPMFRLLDLPAAFAARSAPPEASATVTLEVDDPQLPENRGSWRLRVEGGGMRLERGAGEGDPVLSLPVRTLSRIFIGATSPSRAVAAGEAALDRAAALDVLDRAFRVPQPWTFERF